MAVFYIAEQSALSISGHYYAYTQCVARGARAAGFDVVILENTRFHGDWKIEGVKGVPAFSQTWGEAERQFFHLWAPGNIAYEFVEATRANPPRAGDHVLFPTLGFAELRCILDYLIDLPVSDDLPFIHVLLRYDPELIRISVDLYGALFDKVNATTQLRRKVFFHTDTDLLSAEYARLTGTPFNTLPIPFQQDRLRERLAAQRPRKAGGPVVITYLGDARLEKGYADFPAALEFLKPQLAAGQIRFRLQSNFNSAGGEAGIMPAVQKLGQYPASQVELMMDPLDHEAYYDQLVDSDAVLIPYDPERYRARSSGVLIEAMAAGKPVITTRGSWMETQVSDANAVLCDDSSKLGPALLEMVKGFTRYSAGAKARAAEALDKSQGDHFVAELLKSTRAGLPERSNKAPRVLVVMNGDAVIQQNGAGLVARSQFEYLRKAGYKVAGLFLANDYEAGPKAMEDWTRLLLRQVAEYDLEAVFIAAPGRLSTDILRQQAGRNRYEWSIRSELEKVAAYDVHLGLIDYLNRHPVDVTLLNYITGYPLIERLGLTDKPVICEMLDVQSFQKAIYGQRPVTRADLDEEMKLLGRCQQLISLNASETDFVLERLPDMPIVTTGIFPPAKAAKLDALAGVTSVAELVASTHPLQPELRMNALLKSDSGPLAALQQKSGVDLLFVSSNHFANVSGLRWFLKDVFLPNLAPLGVHMVVAGSIASVAGWPEHPNLTFVGRVDDLAPLYAAARVVVVPIIEGAGAPVKTFEALCYGTPIVATTIAMRACRDLDGVLVADTAEDFTAAIETLLASRPLREEQARKALASAERVSSPGRYASLMNTVFERVLGKRALKGVEQPAPAGERHVLPELDGRILAVNGLIRDWIANRPFSADALRRLALEPADEVANLITTFVDALIVRRSAPLLTQHTRVLSRVLHQTIAGQAEACKPLLIQAIAAQRVGGDADANADSLHVIGLASADLDIHVIGRSGVLPKSIVVDGEAVPLLATGSPLVLRGVRPRAKVPAYDLAFHSVERPIRKTPVQLVVSQDVTFAGDHKVFGEGVLVVQGRQIGSGHVRLFDGETADGLLPRLDGGGGVVATFIDVMTKQESDVELEIRLNDRIVRAVKLLAGDHNVYRVSVSELGPQTRYGVSTLHIAAFGDVTLLGARLHLVTGDAPESTLRQLDHAQGRDMLETLNEVGHAAMIESLAKMVRTGIGPNRARAEALRRRLATSTGRIETSAALPELGSEVSVPQLVACLESGRALAEAGKEATPAETRLVAASGLTMEIEASVGAVGDGDLTCLVNGVAATSLGAVSPAAWRWRVPGEIVSDAPWLRTVQFADDKPVTPTRVSAWFRLPGRLDPVTGEQFLKVENTHAPEMLDGYTGLVWTGPRPRMTLQLPVALTHPGELVVKIANLGENRLPQDLDIFVNGRAIAFTAHRGGESLSLTAPFQPDEEPLAVTEIQIVSHKIHSIPFDHRRLGFAIGEIALVLRLRD